MSSSIREGVKSLKQNTKAVMICLGDMPLIKTSTYNQLLANFYIDNTKKILVPFYNNLRGNPIIFSHHYFNQLSKLTGDYGAKEIINKNKDFAINVNVEDKGIAYDFDTKKDYYDYLNGTDE